ncbi:4610_t:CDS:2, partial [Ambispora leptoticha]
IYLVLTHDLEDLQALRKAHRDKTSSFYFYMLGVMKRQRQVPNGFTNKIIGMDVYPTFVCELLFQRKKLKSWLVKVVEMDAEERLEREIVNYKIKDINCEIREQFNDIDLFAIQSIGYTKLALFVFDLVDGIAIRKGRKELYPIFSNTSEYHQILPNYVTPLSPPHNLA